MDFWDRKSPQDRRKHRRENPSFSSSLLDAIYRSIDDKAEEEVVFYSETMRRNHHQIASSKDDLPEIVSSKDDLSEIKNFRRACMIEKWMEKKKVNDKLILRRTSMADFDRKARNVRDRDFKKLVNSSSSSSESSCGGGFSSSESESKSCSYTMPAKVSVQNQKPKHENGFVKTKSKALKIYGDLKKVKQPISPGRFTTFLNSLFNGGTPKKQNEPTKSKSLQPSACSSASSFSRSCLSKTPSSSLKLSNNGGEKRTVRFCPVSVILDEDSRPCGQKSLKDELGLMAVKKTLRNALKNSHCRAEEAFAEEEEDDDVASCSSSDLFELDNLSSIGIERYREELPVYETTHFSTNQAIANGMIL